jgi:hypothetical protein
MHSRTRSARFLAPRDAGLIKAMILSGHKSQVACVALSADNRRAATASKDGMLKVRRAALCVPIRGWRGAAREYLIAARDAGEWVRQHSTLYCRVA